MDEELNFTIELRGSVYVVVWPNEGCRPATDAEVTMWQALNRRAQPSQGGEAVASRRHGVRLPHECRECVDSVAVPYGWVEPVGGVFVDSFTKMCMRDRDAADYSLPLYTHPSDQVAKGLVVELRAMLARIADAEFAFGEWPSEAEIRQLLAKSEGEKK